MGFLNKLFKPKQVVASSDVINNIDYKGGTKFASNETNNVYADIEELGGFPYLKTTIIGDISVNIKRKGCTITFKFKDADIKLDSDNTTVESSQIKETNAFFTLIDFELNEDEASKIKKGHVKEVVYNFKGKEYSFKPV
jgi:hypothetical protein